MNFIDTSNKINIKSIKIKHGLIDCMSFIINDKCAYASDISEIYKKDLKYFRNLDFFVVDCLRFLKHPSHFHFDKVMKLINEIKPKKTILTNMHSDLDYNNLLKILPKNVIPAYDGFTFIIK